MSHIRVLGRRCMNHTCLLVRQICWRPPGRGHLPREGAGGQPPAAGAGGRAEGLQYLGEHPLSAGPSAVCMTIRCLQDHPLSAGLPRVHWWHGASQRHPSCRSLCHSSCWGAPCASRWSTETPIACGPGRLRLICARPPYLMLWDQH